MKMSYETPIMDVEQFMANEYFAACGDVNATYNFECNAGINYPAKFLGNRGEGTVWLETNGVEGLQTMPSGFFWQDSYVPADQKLGGYHPCGKTHSASTADAFLDGYYISDYTGKTENVIVWRGNSGKNTHCTTDLDIENWEVQKS